ncbi:MAG: hypothetical protein ACKVQU_11395 [Burkholderiales bacterium]
MMKKPIHRSPGARSARRGGFTPISLGEYVKLHIRSNPGTTKEDLIERLRYALDARRKGIKCRCEEPIWVIGSAEAGLSCFTCITGEAEPYQDYEIEGSSDDLAG